MLDRRITYSKDKTEIIRRLQDADESSGPFHLIADVLVFAAAFGLSRNRRVPLAKPLAEPIRQSVFDTQGYDTMMNLVALHADPRSDVLADADEAIESRAKTFEEFANGGLELLQEEARGALDVLEMMVLLINAERRSPEGGSDAFDLSKLLA
jgi:dnd system-associated protein 4